MDKQKFNFNDFKRAGEEFMMILTAKLIERGIPADTLRSDHLCFRVATLAEYDFYKNALSRHGTFLTEAVINGRPISTFQLASSFQTDTHKISLVELPSPKHGSSYATGFEHAEFVISESFADFRSQYTHLNFSEVSTQTLNPELCLKLEAGMQAKFHHLPLDRVIELEQQEMKKNGVPD